MKDKRIENIIFESDNYKFLAPSFEQGEIASSMIFASDDELLNDGLLEALLKKFYCKNVEGDKPCSDCIECSKIENKTHIDVTYFGDGDVSLRKDEIKVLIDNAITKPFETLHKFLIVKNGEKLSDIAQNVLLKTLEDLPSFVTVIILTKSLAKILPTILSRCQVVQLKPLEKKEVIKLLGSNERAIHIAEASDGVLSTAVMYASKSDEFDKDYKFAISLVLGFASSAEMAEKAAYLLNKKDRLKETICIIQSVFYMALKDRINVLLDKRTIAKCVRLCDECISMIDKSVLKNIIVDYLLMNILKYKCL